MTGRTRTPLTALRLGRRFVGIERDEEYVRLAEGRIATEEMVGEFLEF